MMGGPIDTRERRPRSTIATERPHAWFNDNVIAKVPSLL